MKVKYLSLVLAILWLGSCSDKPKDDDNTEVALSETDMNGPKTLPDTMVYEFLESIPSPVEMAFLIKSSGTGYDKALMNNAASAGKYATSGKMALNLGVYGADLGYINTFGVNQDAFGYLEAIKILSGELSIGQYFDQASIRKLVQDNAKLDSLFLLTNRNLQSINRKLHEDKRSHLSVLMVTGGWIEASYLLATYYDKTKKPELKQKLVEQKIVLTAIKKLVDFYVDSPEFEAVGKQLTALEKAYEGIRIMDARQDLASVQKVNGLTVVEGGPTEEMEISEEKIQAISKAMIEARNKIVQL